MLELFKKFKVWAYEVPSYDESYWKTIDKVLSLDNETTNTRFNKLGNKVDSFIDTINFKATKWQLENSYIASKNWDK